MAIPILVGAGSGLELTTGTGTVSKTGCTAGNIIVVHLLQRGTVYDITGGTYVNVNSLDGGTNARDILIAGQWVGNPQADSFSVWVSRAAADGTCSMNLTIGASGADMVARMYEFSGVNAGTTLAAVFENGGLTKIDGVGTSATVGDQAVTTQSTNRLALQFVAIGANQACASFTGETGGDWTEAVAEFASATVGATLQLQTAGIASAGVIDGGTFSITSAAWAVCGTALIPSALTLDTCLPDADVTTTGWSTAPLFSKVNDASDATVITATAS